MAFYTRTIEIDGVIYKQISPSQWQNVKTSQVIDSTKMVYIINEFKSKKGRGSVQPITPGGGASGACCEIPNMISGAFICTEKDEGSCPGGCFKPGQNCNSTDESPEPCVGCVRCCYIADQYCVAKRPEQCVPVGNGGGTYFGSNGCTACKYGVCSSDQNNNTTNATERFYGSRGCTGTFIVGGGVSDFRTGVFCTGSGIGQTCFGPGMQYQALTPNFIQGGTCADCILGACCTGGSCVGITSQSACSILNGLFFAGQTCGLCDFGVYCQGSTTNRTCIRTGYRGENLSNQFQVGATCSYCITGTCCVNGNVSFGDSVRQSTCSGNFFANRFASDACDRGSCCVGSECTENTFRYDCLQTFNIGMTCIACTDGACCLPNSGCTLTTYASCFAQGGTFYGGATCSACDIGSCCNQGRCTDQTRGAGCTGVFYVGANCLNEPCTIGTCCVGATCTGTNIRQIDCINSSGNFYTGVTCNACATGVNCVTPEFPDIFADRDCDLTDYGDFLKYDPNGYFGFGQTCSQCEIGSCCASVQSGNESSIQIRGMCNTGSGIFSFFKGETLSICATGVFCTGSNEGQTCFGLGYRGQSLTNNFIQGATCSSCILGACCTGGTCVGGGLTSQAACSSVGGLFFAGKTCISCDYGVFCTGATCLSLGYRGQSLSNNFIIGATCSSCILGACCTGGTCSGGGQTSQAACNGLFYPGATCRACDYGVYCTGATCFELGYRAQNLTNNFIQGATCNSCILGACCTGGTCLGGGQTSLAACNIAGGTFYVGATCTQCITGVFCTGSGIGQTCFGLGNRGQSLTNNFIAGATCSSCILGACCTGGTCLGGGLTSQAACSAVNGLFYAGTTCVSCDYGVFCTGSDENKTCFQPQSYRAQNLTNEFIVRGGCIDCVFGVCCQGSTCLGITSEASCNAVEGSFIAGATCSSCSSGITGICCTGAGSIQTIEDCTILGGHWFASGTTALCVTGGCCTGGTCIEEIAGKSGNCELFIAGSTCGICDTGVFCTGATCLQLGFRGQSLSTVFIVGETCSSCIQGICCKDDYEYLKIGGGREHSVVLTTQGEVRGFGGNTYGQSGMTLALGYTAIAVGAYHTLALSAGGTVSAWGRNQYGQSTVPTGLTGVMQIAAGEYHSLALKSDGGVTCWGWNGQGQCNVPSGLTGVTMIASGMGHNLALRDNGTVVAWGYNFDGQTNVPTGLTGVIQIAAGYNHSLALLSGGGVTCWGMTAYGQCNIPAGLTASKIVGGGYHTIILLGNGGVTAVGRNNYNQITVPSGLVAKEIGAGEYSSFAINNVNAAVTWGSNINGEGNIDDTSCENLNLKNCDKKFGIFKAGQTNCSACEVKVNCCVGGTCSYILSEECIALGGIVFAGNQDCSLCDSGVFCTGNTCGSGITLKGFALTENFLKDSNCGDCITGVCCNEEYQGQIKTQNQCQDTFYPGEENVNICNVGLTFGICCNNLGECSDNIEQNICNGYFIPNSIATQYGIYCSSNPCEYGVCCKENEVVSITGGVCLGAMRRAECAITAGTFFASSEGATCSNCLYTPMIGSVLFESMAGSGNNVYTTRLRPKAKTGWTGNEQFPRAETKSSGFPSTWLSWQGNPYYYAPPLSPTQTGATTIGIPFRKGSGTYLDLLYMNLKYGSPKFKTWWNGDLTTWGFTQTGNWQGNTGLYDYSPIFDSGITTENGVSYGYIDGLTFASPRYARLVFGYGNPEDPYHNKTMVFRFSHTDSSARKYSRTDATIHAGLDINTFNTNIISPSSPFSDNNGTNRYSSPVLLQMFPENPLTRRIRPIGSCCKGTMCLGIVTKDHCTFTGGTFHENQYCGRCYPETIFGNCCAGGTYAGYTSLANCDAISGVFFEGNTSDAQKCVQGIICNANKTCYQGLSYAYSGAFSSVDGKFFIAGDYRNTLGCNACDASTCCTGSTCLGVLPKVICNSLGGDSLDALNCGDGINVCETGVCCSFDGGCGTFRRRTECTGDNNIFVSGATLGATCSACSSLMRLTQTLPGVTYEFVFNQGTTNGKFLDGTIWVQEKEGLAVRRIRMTYIGMTGDRTLTFYANTKMENMILHPNGFKGSVYVHGSAKNLKPYQEFDPVTGYTENTNQPFISLTYEDYNSGWWVGGKPLIKPKTFEPGATDDPDQYRQFDLRAFLNMKKQFDRDGVTMAAEDVLLVNTTNFDPYQVETLWSEYVDGYPYQLFNRRANSLSYGVISCLNAERATLAGSTLCFRPPVTWPKEIIAEKPLYPVSLINSRVPGMPGNTLITVSRNSTADKNSILLSGAGFQIDSSGNRIYDFDIRNGAFFLSSFTHLNEFGGGANYGTITPVWSMHGPRQRTTSYGEQYVKPLGDLLKVIHATGATFAETGHICTTYLTHEERKLGVAKICQYGIDGWGAMRSFTHLGAAAGQKSVYTRPWVSIAGYFLGVTAMYDPEETLLSDTNRLPKFKEYFFSDKPTCSPKGDCLTDKTWRIYRCGSTAINEPNNKVVKKTVASWFANEAQTTYNYVNDPSNPVLHYDYIGKAYRSVTIKDFGTTGPTGITFFNSMNTSRRLLNGNKDSVVTGNFGVIRWGVGNTQNTANPLIKENPWFDYGTKAGTEGSLQGCWIKVESGPGSCGGNGSRYYRIMAANPTGIRSDADPYTPDVDGGGFQMVIGQTWTDGIPDHTSVLKLYPFIEDDFIGLTRPSTLGLSGIEYGTFPQFIREGDPREFCGGTWTAKSLCSLWDAVSAGSHTYLGTAAAGWQDPYSFLDYITKTRGITLVSDVFAPMDFFRFYIFKSPWNIVSLHGAASDTDTIVNTWYGGYNWQDSSFAKQHINFAKHFPGIKTFWGLTV